MSDKVVLAYSGGLDTSIAISWLKENYGLSVIALAADVGQDGDLEAARLKALASGAEKAIVLDAKKEFVNDFLMPALRANALYEGKYPLVSALSRPLIAKGLVDLAREEGATHVAHGCTGKGNDQVRFEISIRALAPELKILAPAREWGMSREQSIEYAGQRGIPVEATKKSPYSIDENLWGRTVECGLLEDPWVEPPVDAYLLTEDVAKAPEEPAYAEVGFEKGRPISLDGKDMDTQDLISELASLGGAHGFGRVDMIENRLVGIKSREIYEVPGALALIKAHRDLEELTLERELLHYKSLLEQKYSELVYNGMWYSPLKQALDAFFVKTQEPVTGTVRLKFHKGNLSVAGRRSPMALYDYDLATYEKGDRFSHEAAEGFVKLLGLPIEVWAQKQGGGRK